MEASELKDTALVSRSSEISRFTLKDTLRESNIEYAKRKFYAKLKNSSSNLVEELHFYRSSYRRAQRSQSKSSLAPVRRQFSTGIPLSLSNVFVSTESVDQQAKSLISKNRINRCFFAIDLAMLFDNVSKWNTLFPYMEPQFDLSKDSDPALIHCLLNNSIMFQFNSLDDLSKIKQASLTYDDMADNLHLHAWDTAINRSPSYIYTVLCHGIDKYLVDSATEVERIIDIHSRLKESGRAGIRDCLRFVVLVYDDEEEEDTDDDWDDDDDDERRKKALDSVKPQLRPSPYGCPVAELPLVLAALSSSSCASLIGLAVDAGDYSLRIDELETCPLEISIIRMFKSVLVALDQLSSSCMVLQVEFLRLEHTLLTSSSSSSTILSSSCTSTLQECCRRFASVHAHIRLTSTISNIMMDSSCALFCRVDGVKQSDDGGAVDVYIDNGCYGGLSPIMVDEHHQLEDEVGALGQLTVGQVEYRKHMSLVSIGARNDVSLARNDKKGKRRQQYHNLRLWGQTCDSYDLLCRRLPLETIPIVGEWMRFVGSSVINTSPSSQAAFNGFQPADRFYFIQLK